MALNFGQPTGFPSATSTAPTFGGFGTSTTTAAKGFGQQTMGFGSPATSGGFGTTPTLGGFGTGQTTGAFGAPQQTGAFGAPQQTGVFGAPQQTATFGAPTSGAFGGTSNTGFGSTPTSTNFGFGGGTLGTATSTSLFGGTPATGGMFGATQPTTTTTSAFQGFSNFGAPSNTGGLFGNAGGLQTSTANTGFGFSSFGVKPVTSQPGAFGSFGSGGLGTSMFGQVGQQQQQPQFGLGSQQQQQQQQQQPLSPDEAVYHAVSNVNLFGDDRDAALARWNLLQAQWGSGKGYYAQNLPPVTFTQNNPFFRFKALGYSLLPAGKEEEGVISLGFNKKEAELKAQQTQLTASLSSLLLSNRPHLSLALQGVRGSAEGTCQALVTVTERLPSGQARRVPASELAAFVLQARSQLSSLGVESVVPVVGPSPEWVRDYLATPPAGVDPRLWQQAQLDSPDPERFIPVPMVGFAELRWRMRCQESESSRHLAFLAQAEQTANELRRAVNETESKLVQRRQALLGLQRRLLHLLVKLQVARRAGTALLPLEEDLRTRLEQIQAQLSRPSHCKARLGELLAQMRLQHVGSGKSNSPNYSFDADTVRELHKFLSMEQEGISHLIDVASLDRDCLKVISQSMLQGSADSKALLMSKHAKFSQPHVL